jgi:hypothetical protein
MAAGGAAAAAGSYSLNGKKGAPRAIAYERKQGRRALP